MKNSSNIGQMIKDFRMKFDDQQEKTFMLSPIVNRLAKKYLPWIIIPKHTEDDAVRFSFYMAYWDLNLRLAIRAMERNPDNVDLWNRYLDPLDVTDDLKGLRKRFSSLFETDASVAVACTKLLACCLEEDRQSLAAFVQQVTKVINSEDVLARNMKSQLHKDILIFSLERFGVFSDYEIHGGQSSNGRVDIDDIVNYLCPIYSMGQLLKSLSPTSDILVERILKVNLSSIKGKWIDTGLLPSNLLYEKLNFSGDVTFLNQLSVEITPQTSFDDILLDEEIKNDIRSLCHGYKNQKLSNLSFLFFGRTGVGKSLLAHSIAKELGRKILRVSLVDTDQSDIATTVQFLAKQAERSNFVLHFEEADNILRSSSKSDHAQGWLKVLFEEFTGAVIFTSNYSSEDALLRRMTYFREMSIPCREHREVILHKEIKSFAGTRALKSEVSENLIKKLSHLELSPGHIKSVLGLAISSGDLLTDEILEKSFNSRVNDQLGSFSGTSIPELNDSEIQLEFDTDMQDDINRIFRFSKFVLKGEKPFTDFPSGLSVLLSGPSGTGKTALAGELAKKIGLPLKKVSASDLLDAYVGESEKKIAKLFREASKKKSIILIDEAEALLSNRNNAVRSWEVSQVGEFLRHLEDHKGIVFVATNHPEMLDVAFQRRFFFKVEFKTPSPEVRNKILKNWNHIFQRSDEELKKVSEQFKLTGALIRLIAIKYYIYQVESGVPLENIVAAELDGNWDQKRVIGFG